MLPGDICGMCSPTGSVRLQTDRGGMDALGVVPQVEQPLFQTITEFRDEDPFRSGGILRNPYPLLDSLPPSRDRRGSS